MTTVLVVDDQEWNRDLIARYLTDWGYDVVPAADGAEALRLVRTAKPQLILMDLDMPVMDGWEARTVLAADAETSHIPIMALTAAAMCGDREKILAAGFHAYHEKPINVLRLQETVRKLLES
jgi:two-component system cell cycle response regulator DivK